ncbi:MAG: alpha/beta hydrolase [Microbacteriaceae bacterium]
MKPVAVNRVRGSRRTSRVILSALTAGLMVALAGCMFLPQTPKAPAAPAQEKVAPDLQPFYQQSLNWTDCAKGMQCTDATAPLNWADPAAGSITLALIRHRATGHKIGSLLVNPGGPGASGYTFVKDSVDYATDQKLQAGFDIVGFDPRGVGHSSAVSCYKPAQMDDYIYGIPDAALGTDAWIAEQTASATAFAAACAANTGALLGHVDTVSAARDLDLLRAVLGDSKLSYLGYSYGTFLGATYANLYPKNVGRLVLDGALDPSASNFEVTKTQAQGFESALRAYLTDCIGTQGCPFRGSVDQAMQTIADLLAAVGESPIRNADGRELGSTTLLTAIIYPLYDANAWPVLSEMLSATMQGDAAEAFHFADAYNDRTDQGTYTSNQTEAFTAINCLDYSYNADPATMRSQAAELEKAAPVIGKYMAYGDIACAAWPDKFTGKRGAITAAGAAPILVVGTTNDPATPYVWAKNLAEQLDSGHLVTYTGQGHTAYNKSNSCVNNAVDNYLLSGTVPTTDPRC